MHKKQRTFMGQLIDAGNYAKQGVGRFLKGNGKYFWGASGLISFSAAAFFVAVPVGLAVMGVCFFAMEWRVAQR